MEKPGFEFQYKRQNGLKTEAKFQLWHNSRYPHSWSRRPRSGRLAHSGSKTIKRPVDDRSAASARGALLDELDTKKAV